MKSIQIRPKIKSKKNRNQKNCMKTMKKPAKIAWNHKKPWKNEKTVEKLEVVPSIGPALLRLPVAPRCWAVCWCAAGPKQVGWPGPVLVLAMEIIEKGGSSIICS
jgi:hypothetical protein